MVICEGLKFAIQHGYFALKVELDSVTMVSWIISHNSTRWDFAYLLGQVCALSSSPSICIRYVHWETTFAANSMANWACSHQAH